MESINGIYKLITVNEFQHICCKITPAFNNRSVSSCNTADKQLSNDTYETSKSTFSVNEKISKPCPTEVIPCNSEDDLHSENTPDEELMEEGLIEIDDYTALDRALDDYTALNGSLTYDSPEKPSELWDEMIAHEFAKNSNLSQDEIYWTFDSSKH